MMDETVSLETYRFLPDLDLTDYKPYGKYQRPLEVKRLRPEHALALQKALKGGSDHIAGYFSWGEKAQHWTTKQALFWIQAQIREEFPCEHFAFFIGKEMTGMGSIRPYGDVKKVQMAYWVSNKYLKQGIGETIARSIAHLALNYRPYHSIYIDHDESNTSSGAIPKKLGYRYAGSFQIPIHAKRETGKWLSWVKESGRYLDCDSERLMDLRFADLWCQMINQMHPEIYEDQYKELHQEAIEAFKTERNIVRSISYDDLSEIMNHAPV